MSSDIVEEYSDHHQQHSEPRSPDEPLNLVKKKSSDSSSGDEGEEDVVVVDDDDDEDEELVALMSKSKSSDGSFQGSLLHRLNRNFNSYMREATNPTDSPVAQCSNQQKPSTYLTVRKWLYNSARHKLKSSIVFEASSSSMDADYSGDFPSPSSLVLEPRTFYHADAPPCVCDGDCRCGMGLSLSMPLVDYFPRSIFGDIPDRDPKQLFESILKTDLSDESTLDLEEWCASVGIVAATPPQPSHPQPQPAPEQQQQQQFDWKAAAESISRQHEYEANYNLTDIESLNNPNCLRIEIPPNTIPLPMVYNSRLMPTNCVLILASDYQNQLDTQAGERCLLCNEAGCNKLNIKTSNYWKQNLEGPNRAGVDWNLFFVQCEFCSVRLYSDDDLLKHACWGKNKPDDSPTGGGGKRSRNIRIRLQNK